MKLEGKSVIVTGGGSGIGRAIALEFAKEGAQVAVADIDTDALEKETKDRDYNMIFITTDVRDTAGVNNMANQVSREFSKIDILVNNAGYSDGKGVEVQSEEEWNDMFNVNVNGYARCVRAALPYLKQTKGNILNIASLVGLNGQANAFSYCSTKGAIIGMTKNLAVDLAKYGIRVNALCPGWILSDLLKIKWTARQQNPDTALDELARKHPLGRIGTPEDCAKGALYLCSDDAAFVTGITLALDGGISLGYK